MKHTLTYNQLLTADQDIYKIQKNQPGLALLESGRIQLFYQQAANALQEINKKIKEIKEKYVQKDKDGNFLVADNGQWKFYASVSDIANAKILTGAQVVAAFEKEGSDYLNSKTIDLVL